MPYKQLISRYEKLFLSTIELVPHLLASNAFRAHVVSPLSFEIPSGSDEQSHAKQDVSDVSIQLYRSICSPSSLQLDISSLTNIAVPLASHLSTIAPWTIALTCTKLRVISVTDSVNESCSLVLSSPSIWMAQLMFKGLSLLQVPSILSIPWCSIRFLWYKEEVKMQMAYLSINTAGIFDWDTTILHPYKFQLMVGCHTVCIIGYFLSFLLSVTHLYANISYISKIM